MSEQHAYHQISISARRNGSLQSVSSQCSIDSAPISPVDDLNDENALNETGTSLENAHSINTTGQIGERGQLASNGVFNKSPMLDITSRDTDADRTDCSHCSTSLVETSNRLENPTKLLDKRKPWNPFWLYRSTIFSLALIFLMSAITVVVLWTISVHKSGFPLLTDNHYVWTYAPTAVLTIYTIMWRLIDFWSMSLAPWQRLKDGNTSAATSVLLDYVSPILPTALFEAIKLKETTVVITMIGGLLLRLVVIASSGLLVSLPARFTSVDQPLELTTTFNASIYAQGQDFDSTTQADTLYQVYTSLVLGQPYANGIQSNLAYQTFIPSNSSQNYTQSVVSAEVDAFYPIFTCSEAQVIARNVSFEYNADGWNTNLSMSVSWDACPSSHQEPVSILQWIIDPTHGMSPPRQMYGNWYEPIQCANESDIYWQPITFTDVYFNQPSEAGATFQYQQQNSSGNWLIQIMPISAIVCRFSYSIEQARVSYDYRDDPVTIVVDGPLTQTQKMLPGFGPSDFQERFSADSNWARFIVGNDVTSAMALESPDTMSMIMAGVANASYEDFMKDQAKMIMAATQVFNNTAAQIAINYVTLNSSVPTQGNITSSQSRLYVAQVSVWLMFSGLMFVATMGFCLIWIRAYNLIPCDTTLIGGILLITARSSSLQKVLRGTGRMTLTSIQGALSNVSFTTTGLQNAGEDYFVIHATSSDIVDHHSLLRNRQAPRKSPESKWWKPLALRPPVFAFIMALPIALIATLEVLQRLSARDIGILATEKADGLRTIVGTRLVPALVMVIVSLCYDSLCFNVSLFAPFQKLKNGNATISNTLMSSLIGKVPVHALYLSIVHKHWAAFFANLASILGSVLTIIVSGLYLIDKTSVPSKITIERQDLFDPAWNNSVISDGGAAAIVTAVEFLNLSQPLFTFDELAFPTLQLQPSVAARVNGSNSVATDLSVRIPALRASLNCTVASQDDYSVSLDPLYHDGTGGLLTLNGSALLPSNCRKGGSQGDSPSVVWNITWQPDEFAGYIGLVADLHVGPYESSMSSWGEMNSTVQEDNPAGCPSLMFTFGYMSHDDAFYNNSKTNMTTMSCFQLMTEIEADVVFSVPNWTIKSATPDETTIRYLESSSNGTTAFEYRPQVHLQYELATFNESFGSGIQNGAGGISDQSVIDNVVDEFFAVLVTGKNAPDPTTLVGPDNFSRLETAIQALYRRYMAQVASLKMRTHISTPEKSASVSSSSSIASTYTGTWVDPTSNVLRQNETSKIILQALLATMFVCGGIAYYLLDADETLTHNPCSIAGTASLFVDSDVCPDLIMALAPRDAEWMSVKELKRSQFWNGWRFSLGWRDWHWGEMRRFGIDVGDADHIDLRPEREEKKWTKWIESSKLRARKGFQRKKHI